MMITSLLSRCLLQLVLASLLPLSVVQASPDHLLLNGRRSPLGISCKGVSFSWVESALLPGATQVAYQIQLFENDQQTPFWDSGRTLSAEQTGVALTKSTVLRPGTRYRWRVKTWFSESDTSTWSEASFFETGLETSEDWHGAKWIRAGVEKDNQNPVNPLPVFLKTAEVRKSVARARLYATARGLYEIHLNGNKVGDHRLAPGWTDYNKKFQVQTYDVTENVPVGPLHIEALVGDGWYRGKVGLGWSRVYGESLAVILYLRVEYKDGTRDDFVSDESWSSAPGPFVSADLQDGEHYDARLDRRLQNLEPKGPSSAGTVISEQPDYAQLVPQPDEPVRQTELLKPVEIVKTAQGTYQVDFGQNMVGVVRLRFNGTQGQTITLQHAEERFRQGPTKGSLYRENLRSAKAEDHFTVGSSGKIEYQPTFTQHGFRYVEIAGLNEPLKATDIDGVVLGSDLQRAGELETSNPLLNQLISNVRWGQRGNFVSIPTDTPARDERLGWTGDIAVFAPTACRLSDARAFLSKWMEDVTDAQKPDGNLPAVVPQPRKEFDETGVGWSDAAIQVPYAVWKATGDKAFLERHWPTIKRMYSFIHDSATKDGDFLEQGRASWFSGDWLSLEPVDRLAEHPLIATAYFANDSLMMSEMASVLGDLELASRCQSARAGAQAAFARAYVAPDGTLQPATQTVYALALGMDLLENPGQRDRVARRFVEKLEADHLHLRTGFLGTPWLLPALSSIGRDDLALRLLLNEDYPSWGYEIRQGATTVWERWNSIQPDGKFGPVEMNSFNHYAYGAVVDWVYEKIGGVKIIEPGYRKIRLSPLVTLPGVKSAKLRQETSFGLLSFSWARLRSSVHFDLTLPSGCTAQFALPEQGISVKTEAGPPVPFHSSDGAKKEVNLPSGHYSFTILLDKDFDEN